MITKPMSLSMITEKLAAPTTHNMLCAYCMIQSLCDERDASLTEAE